MGALGTTGRLREAPERRTVQWEDEPVTPEIQARVIDRLIDTGKADEPWALIALAAMEGSDQLDQFLDKKVAVAPPTRAEVSTHAISESPGAYLASISVEG